MLSQNTTPSASQLWRVEIKIGEGLPHNSFQRASLSSKEALPHAIAVLHPLSSHPRRDTGFPLFTWGVCFLWNFQLRSLRTQTELTFFHRTLHHIFLNLPKIIPFLGWKQALEFSNWKEFIWQRTEKNSYEAIKTTAELQHMLQTHSHTHLETNSHGAELFLLAKSNFCRVVFHLSSQHRFWG